MPGGHFAILMFLLWPFLSGGIGEQIKALLNSQVKLQSCHVHKENVTRVEWTKIANSSRRLLYTFEKPNSTMCMINHCQNIAFDIQNMSLILFNLTANDEAIYEEKIFFSKEFKRCNITLSLLSPPDTLGITVSSSDSALSLSCEVKGEFLNLHWLRDGLLLPEDQRISFSEKNMSMTVSNMTSSDCRMYTCQASNQAGKSEVHVNIPGTISSVCQDKFPRSSAQILTYLYFIGPSLVLILVLCSVLFCIRNYGCCKRPKSRRGPRRANDISLQEPVYDEPLNSQEEANTQNVNPLPYVYMDYIKPKAQQTGAEEQLDEDFGYSTIAEVRENKQPPQTPHKLIEQQVCV